jgi:uncharacterized membrane protein
LSTRAKRPKSWPWRPYLPWIDAAAFSVSGVIHLAHPATFTPIVPRFLPFRTGLVYASGVTELVCAVGLWRRDRWAGVAAAFLLLAIWPANLQDAISTQHGDNLTLKIAIWFRLPLQIPLIWFALQSGRQKGATGGEVSVGRRDAIGSGQDQILHGDDPVH